MNSGQKCSRPVLGLLLRRSLLSNSSKPCVLRTYSTATTATSTTAESASAGFTYDLEARKEADASESFSVASAVILSRPPMLTRDLPDFESSYYFYQRRLNDRLQLPFTRWFYFKKGTLADQEWKRKQAAANKYNPYGPRGWADELLVGDNSHISEDNGYQYLVDTTVTGEEDTLRMATTRAEAAKEAEAKGEPFEHPTEIVAKPFPRTSQADLENDTKSLNRKMSRTLYLLVKKNRDEFAWRFPQSVLVGDENLREGAERTLKEAAGVNMHTWFVGNVPIGHRAYNYPWGIVDEGKKGGKKVFFMKARILAGQADLTDNKLGLDDFKWVTKEEIQPLVSGKYWRALKGVLSDR